MRRNLLLQEYNDTKPSPPLVAMRGSSWKCVHYDSKGSKLEATDGLLFACLQHGDFGNEVEHLLKEYCRIDEWGIHQLRIYVGNEKWHKAEKFGERLLGDGVVKSQQWKKLAVVGLLAEVKVNLGKILEGQQLLVKVVKEGLADDGLPHLHPLLCGDRLVSIYLDQKRLVQAGDILHHLHQFKERMHLSFRMPIGWSPLRGDKTEFSKAVWDAAFVALSHTKHVERVSKYQSPKNMVIAVLLSLFDNRYKQAKLYIQQGRYKTAGPIFETLMGANLHPENQSMVACRNDLEESARVCVELKDWRNAEWIQELIVEAKDQLYNSHYEKELQSVSEDRQAATKDWEPTQKWESLRLLSRIY
ncbi:hypothetical protein CPB83DRAFT_899284 [Crepidotus variabilis]|uniref:Uncharacterized protein n=1 Tax=Crepidotus variabilis TaxID=179855 RepID=A0A9P6JJB4_9AGAR|nr:hypothetical protein CPB83DRAFT_899284 [Crepidotus variabilis]